MYQPRITISLLVLSGLLFAFGFVARGVTYINTPTNEIVVDFKTGQLFPVDKFVYVQNGSNDKIRYDATSTNSWMLVYREGNRNLSSVTMLGGNSVNFSVEIHPENLASGLYAGTVTIKAVNPSTDNVLESKDIKITLKKDYIQPTPTVSATPVPTLEISPAPSTSSGPTPTASATPPSQVIRPADRGFISLSVLNLREGNVISAPGSSDPDIYIVNDWGYKRLFLNPVIFGFYGHLGGFASVKNVVSITRDTLVTSGLFRNCEADDGRVYGLEVTGEDIGRLHWVNITGDQAVAQDPEFFKKVFCINNREFDWYSKGSDYVSTGQVPDYSR